MNEPVNSDAHGDDQVSVDSGGDPPAGADSVFDPIDSDAPMPDLGALLGKDVLNQIAGIEMGDVVESIAMEADEEASTQTLEKVHATGSSEDATEHLEELAEDMLSLMKRVSSIEEGQQQILASLHELKESSSQSSRTIAREVDTLRRDLVGDRKHTASTGLFNELIPMIDRLSTMRDHLDPDDDARMISQADGVLETLCACLRRLGCEEFEASPGMAFDPNRMQCEEYVVDGDPGKVLATVRPGYMFGQFVLRPTTVKVGAEATNANDSSGDESDE